MNSHTMPMTVDGTIENSSILRSRIEEQSKLIMSLKQRNDHLLAKEKSATSQNHQLIKQQSLLTEQLSKNDKDFAKLEKRFDTLYETNRDIVRIKDEYKKSVEHLTLINNKLKEQLNAKESNRVLDLSNEISRLNELLSSDGRLLEQERKKNLEMLQKHSNLESDYKNITIKNEQFLEKYHKLELESINLADQNSKFKSNNINLQNEINNLVKSNFDRGEKISNLQKENAKKEAKITELESSIKNLIQSFREERSKIDVNYQIRSLRQQNDQLKNEISVLNLHKDKLRSELNVEKNLNNRLRMYN